MAFPVVETTAESATTTAGTSHTVTLPTGIVSGDLVIVLFAKAAASTVGTLTGWTELVDTASIADSETILYRYCDGTEGASIGLTTTASTKSATIAYRISGAENPATQAPQLSAIATGADTTTADSPLLTPTGGAKDYLWLSAWVGAEEEADDDTWANSAPSNFTNLLQKTTSTAGTAATNCTLASAQRAFNASSLDPGVWGAPDVATAWRAFTIAVHPSTAQTITGIVLSTTPSLPIARIDKTVHGIVLSTTPSLPAGTIESGQTVTGVVLATVPVLPVGRLDHSLTGVVLSVTPTLPAGRLDHGLSGTVLAVVPSLPAGSITTGHVLTGVVLSVIPSLPAGSLIQDLTLTGVALSTIPSLPVGRLDHTLIGNTLNVFPNLPSGSLLYDQILTGIVLNILPQLPIGSVSHEVLVSIFHEVSDNQTCMDPTHDHRTATNRPFVPKGPRGRTIRRGI